jgi:hypothetical protein
MRAIVSVDRKTYTARHDLANRLNGLYQVIPHSRSQLGGRTDQQASLPHQVPFLGRQKYRAIGGAHCLIVPGSPVCPQLSIAPRCFRRFWNRSVAATSMTAPMIARAAVSFQRNRNVVW